VRCLFPLCEVLMNGSLSGCQKNKLHDYLQETTKTQSLEQIGPFCLDHPPLLLLCKLRTLDVTLEVGGGNFAAAPCSAESPSSRAGLENHFVDKSTTRSTRYIIPPLTYLPDLSLLKVTPHLNCSTPTSTLLFFFEG